MENSPISKNVAVVWTVKKENAREKTEKVLKHLQIAWNIEAAKIEGTSIPPSKTDLWSSAAPIHRLKNHGSIN